MPYALASPAGLLVSGAYRPRRRFVQRRGVGAYGLGISREEFGSLAVSTATPVITGALASSAAATAVATGTPAVILGMAPALAVPVIGAAMVGVTIAVVALLRASRGCGATCVQTSEWANQAEALLKDNLNAYMALPVPRSRSAWNTAISNFNVVWAQLVQLCGDPAMGDAGRRCVSDRQSGACVWRDASGQCWNWFKGYLDPIQNDTQVATDGGGLLDWSGDLGFSGDSKSLLPLAGIGALLLLAWLA